MEELLKRQDELINLIEHHSNQDGIFKTTIPSLSIIRRANVTERAYGVYNPSFCFIAQGMKQVFLAEERFEYGPSNYLVSSMNLPVIGQVIEASSDAPYLSLKLEFTQNEILEVLLDSKIHINPKENASRAMFVGQIDLSILDPVLRLAQLLNHPQDISFLAPFHKREIIYRLLQGHFGVALAQIAMEGSSTNRIRDAIDHITLHYDQPFRIEELAEIASMSISSFHRHFKEITAMSPLQFQKQLRLQEARRLLLTESADASEVAFRVGYESPSQFSREYSRMFGSPPKADIKRLKETYDQTQEITEHIIAGSNV